MWVCKELEIALRRYDGGNLTPGGGRKRRKPLVEKRCEGETMVLARLISPL